MLTQREADVLNHLDSAALLRDLDEMISHRSLGGAETDIQHWMGRRLRALGLEVEEWDLDLAALASDPSFSMEVARDRGVGVVGTLGDGDGPVLILNGHVDVVPTGDLQQWTVNPWCATVQNDRVYGRGACDMKGGLAAALAALAALQASGARLAGRVALHSVIAEEDGGAGTLATLRRGHRGDAAISMEPTELAIAPAHCGALSFRVSVPGLATHGAVREEGVSAIEKFAIVHRALLDLERARNIRLRQPLFARYELPYALSIGKVQAGDWPSSVPDLLVAEGRYGMAPGEDERAARAEFESAIARVAQGDPWLAQHPPTVEWWGGQFLPARISDAEPILETTRAAFADLAGRPATIEGMTYGADMRLLVNEGGIPTVLFGPGNVRQAHRADEFVPIADLMIVARTIALAAMRFCGGQ